jgi:hypothetical protein
MQRWALAIEQLNDGESDWIGTTGRACGEYAVGPLVKRRAADEFKPFRPVEGPDYEEMGKAFDVREPKFELRENLEYAFGIVFCAEAFGNGLGVGVGAANKSDGSWSKHCGPVLVP